MKKLILDLDGVLYDWHSSVYEYMKLYNNYKGTIMDFWTKESKEKSGEWWTYITGIDTLYSDRQPTEDCKKFINNVQDKFEIYYVTGRPESVKLTTAQYLRRYKFPYQENLIFSNDKINIARLVRASYAIDDLPSQIQPLSLVTKVIMRARIWNREYWDTYLTIHFLMDALQYLEAI